MLIHSVFSFRRSLNCYDLTEKRNLYLPAIPGELTSEVFSEKGNKNNKSAENIVVNKCLK